MNEAIQVKSNGNSACHSLVGSGRSKSEFNYSKFLSSRNSIYSLSVYR